MKKSNIKFSSLMLSLILAISSCAPSQKHDQNKNNTQNAGITENEADLPPIIEQELVSTDDNFQKILEDQNKAAEYEAPTNAIQNGEDLLYVGYTKLKNVKSVYNRTKNELEVSGIAEILNADKKSVRVKQEFKIKGKYKADSGVIKLRPVEDSKDEKDIQVRAVVTCFKSDIGEKYDCARAIIDLFIKHQNNFYTEQLEATSFDKPKVVGAGKEKEKKPEIDMDLVDPEADNNQVKVTPEGQAEDKKPVIDTVVKTPTASKPAVVIDDSKEEADPEALAEVEEGDDDSIAGRYEGKAALVKLAKLFLSDKDIEELDSNDGKPKSSKDDKDEDDDSDDHQAAVPVQKDTKGRLRLSNQAVGSPDNGRLRNASFLKTHIETYKLIDKVVIANSSPKNYYGTQEMMEILEAIGEKANTLQRNKIFISRISAKAGGRLPPSKSHQNGMDVDIGYFTVQGKVQFPIVASGGSLRKSDFSVAKTLEVFKFLMTQQVSPVDRLFVDQSIINNLCREAKNSGKFKGSEKAAYAKLFENMQHVDGHGNHFHLRLRCTKNQPDCQHRIYKKMNNCAG
ncbi:penicillin-insensitive murein endopeptidase [Pseudobdellovibrio sp. HCB154]|uniref:penicillin-insensitive murein endopeptidase n=1 Tax=Pseudobdellovibrio sp. HCB154 TaxID=3386277 RepID=UPI003916F949